MLHSESFQIIRIINLLIGFLYLYYFTIGMGFHLLGIGALNIGAWVFTRKGKNERVDN